MNQLPNPRGIHIGVLAAQRLGDLRMLESTRMRVLRQLLSLPLDLASVEDWTAQYSIELAALRSPGDLRDLTTRWRAIWTVPHAYNWTATIHERLLTAGQYRACQRV